MDTIFLYLRIIKQLNQLLVNMVKTPAFKLSIKE